MHRRAPAALLAATLALLIGPAAASAAQDYLAAVRGRRRQRWSRRAAAAGVDLEHAGYDPGKSYNQTLAVVLTQSDADQCSSAAESARGRRAPDPRAEGAARDRWRQPESVLRRLPPVHGARRHPRRDGPARCGQPRRRQVRARRHVDARQAGLGPEGHRGRPQRAGRHRPRSSTRPTTTPASGSPPSRAPAHEVGDRAQERPADRRPAGPHRAVVHADPERRRLRLHVHLRRRRGQPPVRAERDAEQSLLAQDAAGQRRRRHLRRAVSERPGRRRRPEPELSGQARHRRGGRHQPEPVARPIAARTRSPSPRTSRSTACCARSTSRPTSTTTPPASCCSRRCRTSPTTRRSTRRSSTR